MPARQAASPHPLIWFGAIALVMGSLVHHGGDDVSTLYFALMGGLVWAFGLLFATEQTTAVPRSAVSIGMILFPIALWASCLWSILPATSFEVASSVGTLAIGYWLVRQSLNRGIDWTAIVWLLRGAGGIAACAAIGEYLVTRQRTMGLFLDFNAQAGFLSALTLSAAGEMLWRLRSGASKRQLWPLMLLIGVQLLALATTRSLSGLLQFAGGITLLTLMAGWRLPGTLKLTALMLAALTLSLGLVSISADNSSDPLAKLESLQNHASFTDRVKMAQASFHMFRDHAPLGSGLGSYKALYHRYRDPGENSTTGDLSHNDYAQLLAEGGPVLLAFPLLLLGWLCRRGWALVRTSGSSVDARQAGWIAALVALMAHASMNFIIYATPLALLMGLLLGMLDRPEVQPPGHTGQKSVSRRAISGLLIVVGLAFSFTLGLRALFLSSQAEHCEFQVCRGLHQSPQRAHGLAVLLAATQPSWIPARLYLIETYRVEAQRQREPEARDFWLRKALEENLLLLRQLPDIDLGYSSLADLLADAPELAAQIPTNLPHTRIELLQKALSFDPLDLKSRRELADELQREGSEEQAFALLYDDGRAPWKLSFLPANERIELAHMALALGLKLGHCTKALSIAGTLSNSFPSDGMAKRVAGLSPDAIRENEPGCGMPPES